MGQLELIYVLSTSFSVNPVAYVSSSFPLGREGQAGAGGWGLEAGGLLAHRKKKINFFFLL